MSKVDVAAGRVDPGGLDRLGVAASSQLRVSSVTGEGVERARQAVAAWFSCGGAAEGAVPGSARQVDCLRRAAESVSRAVEQARGGWTEDVVVLSIEEAAKALAELTGKRVSEETLNQVFSRFCVGK